jgi:hypothetical protein
MVIFLLFYFLSLFIYVHKPIKERATKLKENYETMCLLQNDGGGSFPLTIEIEGKKGWLMGMQPENDLTVTQRATKWSYVSFKFEYIVI